MVENFFRVGHFLAWSNFFEKRGSGLWEVNFCLENFLWGGFSGNLISNWKKIGTAERHSKIDQSISPGYRGDYHQDYPSPRTTPVCKSKVGHYKFMVREVVWLFRPGLPRNPTKHNCQVLHQKIIANTDAGNYVLCQIKNVSI